MPYVPRQEEKKLVDECLQGDQKAQKQLYQLYYGKMLGICLRYCKDREGAKDVLQDGFIKVFQKLGQFNFNSPLEGWIRRVVVNTAIDNYRRNATEPHTYDIEDVAGEVTDDTDIISDMNHEELLSCLTSLPDGYRMVFNMYVIEGYSHKEIAEKLGVTEGTSKSQLSKAKVYLQKLISRKYSSQRNGSEL